MKRMLSLLFFVSAGCKNVDQRALPYSIDSQKQNKYLQTHLKDTTLVRANCIVFLRPDSLTFENSKEEEGSYEADSDFGFAISEAIDSIKRNLKGVATHVITDRYIKVEECKSCPIIIDRDTINYGNILISKKRTIQINSGILAGHYTDQMQKYFK